MKPFLLVLTCAIFAALVPMHAAGPDEEYVQIYKWISEADRLAAEGQADLARNRYLQAQSALRRLQTSYPNWNDRVIQFRLNYLDQKLGTAQPRLPIAAPSPAQPKPQAPQPQLEAAPTPVPAEQEAQMQALRAQLQQLQAMNSVLEAKLREALSARPAAIDPMELREANDRIRMLEKEKELLRVALGQEKERNRSGTAEDPKQIAELKRALTEARQELKSRMETIDALVEERNILRRQLGSRESDPDKLLALRLENEELKRRLAMRSEGQVQATLPQPAVNPVNPDLERTRAELRKNEALVAELRASLERLQDEKASLQQAKAELEKRLAALSARGTVATASSSGTERIQAVERERDELQRKLNEVTRQLYDNKAATRSVEREQIDNQLSILRARLDVFEAKKVPYTPEELALFRPPQVMAVAAKPKPRSESTVPRRPLRELPPGAATLLAEAQRAFVARRFEEAEEKFKQLLEMDDQNVHTLANLAATQLEQGRFDDAEANLKKALSLNPDDSHALQLFGILRFRQADFDEALNHLSRAAQLDPQNAETQNYLGVTLCQKGQRAAGETALRKAIQLAPGYGGAHHNLAVIYATQDPPFTELARWHYQKALAAGYPESPELEKLIEGGTGRSATGQSGKAGEPGAKSEGPEQKQAE